MPHKIKSEITDVPFFQPIQDGPIAIAHQTNTPPQIESASETMARHGLPPYVEIDITTNRDGTPMVFHGANTPIQKIQRGLSVPSGPDLRLMSDDDLKRYNLRHPDKPISTLEEILASFPNVRFVLHLKDSQPEALAAVLKSTNSWANVCAGAMRGKPLKELHAVLGEMERKIAMIIALSDTIFVAPRVGMFKGFYDPETARQRWEGLGYPTAWNALSQTTTDMVDRAKKALSIPLIASHMYTSEPLTPAVADRQYTKGFDGYMGDDVAIIATAAAKKRRSSRAI
ncbi:hypothetical protein FWH58_02785 [Candidatus Saccharibacteria bacterium]|nr:hypothetical protein [Candidatus Saccharibacteria bacterium]